MNPRYDQVALRAGYRCEYCRAPEGVFNFPFEIEHIIPISREGTDTEINWALACRSCNLLTGETELFLWGDVDLSWRHPRGFDNV